MAVREPRAGAAGPPRRAARGPHRNAPARQDRAADADADPLGDHRPPPRPLGRPDPGAVGLHHTQGGRKPVVTPAARGYPPGMTITYEWRGEFDNADVNALHAEGFHHRALDIDWHAQVHRHSLGWVCARRDGGLVGFVNVAWDGDVHAFILDTMVTAAHRRSGVGAALVSVAAREARAAGCEWLHVDFEEELRDFYFGACGFTPTNAGLIAL